MSAAVIAPTVVPVTATAATPVTPPTPPTASASTAGASSNSSSHGASSSAAPAAPAPAIATSSMGEYLESALSAMEVKFAARKLAFKNSLQETINSWKGRHGHSSGEVVPLPSPALKGGASTSGGAQSHLRRHASVTYRPPMRDVDESAVDSTDNRDTVGPQSSLEGMGSREEQSLTGAAGAGSHWHAHSQTRKLAQQGELSVLVHMYDHFEEEEGDERNALAAASDPEADIAFSDAEADADGNVAVGGECAREPSLSACEPMLPHAHAHDHGHGHAHGHALTMHKDGCKCSVGTDAGADVSSDAELVPPTAATVSVFVPVAHARAEEEEESCADREPSTSSASHNVSIHFHSTTQSELSPCANAASVDGVAVAGECTEVGHEHGPASSTGALARRHVLLASELDPEFVVARASPELLVATRWEDSAHPYEHGSIVPRAPAFTCACPFPWRSLGHLEKHLQPADHARNITFEGCQYPGWRGQFYANGEPKALLRGVFHELAFIAVTVYSIFVFRSCSSPMAWLAAFVHIGAGWALYGVSSQFHRRLWLLPTYNALKRCDHSAIFLLAAGSSTPAALLMLRDNWSVGSVSLAGLVLLVWSWTVALTGVAHSCCKSLTGRVPLFGLVWMGVSGACMVPFVYQCYLVMTSLEFGSVICAWLLYAAAVTVYSRQLLNLWPSVFGYHEIFHALTIVGGVFTCIFNSSICARIT